MDIDKSELRWGVAQRLEFIEFRLFWEGRVNRSDLMEQFGLSVNQASHRPKPLHRLRSGKHAL